MNRFNKMNLMQSRCFYTVVLLLILTSCDFPGLGGLDGEPQLTFVSEQEGLCFQYYVDKNADAQAIKTQLQLHKANLILMSISIPGLSEASDCNGIKPGAVCMDRYEGVVGKKKLPIRSQMKLSYDKERWPDLDKARRDCSRQTGSNRKFITI